MKCSVYSTYYVCCCTDEDDDEADSVDDGDVGDISDLMNTCCNTINNQIMVNVEGGVDSSSNNQVEATLLEDVHEHMKGMSRYKRRKAKNLLHFEKLESKMT